MWPCQCRELKLCCRHAKDKILQTWPGGRARPCSTFGSISDTGIDEICCIRSNMHTTYNTSRLITRALPADTARSTGWGVSLWSVGPHSNTSKGRDSDISGARLSKLTCGVCCGMFESAGNHRAAQCQHSPLRPAYNRYIMYSCS